MYGCTIACWSGKTSTPADYETRQERIKAHDLFDIIWKSGKLKRTTAYRMLAMYLDTKSEDTHIGMFDKETAIKTQEYAKDLIQNQFPDIRKKVER